MQDVLVIIPFIVVFILLFVCSNKRASVEEQTINKLLSQHRTTNHKLKFKCKNCGNEFTANKKDCKHKSFVNVACIGLTDDYYYKNCPTCGKECSKIL